MHRIKHARVKLPTRRDVQRAMHSCRRGGRRTLRPTKQKVDARNKNTACDSTLATNLIENKLSHGVVLDVQRDGRYELRRPLGRSHRQVLRLPPCQNINMSGGIHVAR